MYVPDDFAGLAALSERVRRIVLRWAQRHPGPVKHAQPSPRSAVGSVPGLTRERTDTVCDWARPAIRPSSRLAPPQCGGQGRYGVRNRILRRRSLNSSPYSKIGR